MNHKELLVLIPKRTNRLVFIINHFCKDQMGLTAKYSTDVNEFAAYQGAKIHFGNAALGDEFFIAADPLLFERGIEEKDLNMGTYQYLPSIFSTYNRKSQYPFDLFAASFYLITRYEEYLPYIKDRYGRYSATESLAYRNGFLRKPLIDYWAMDLAQKLTARFPLLEIESPAYKFIPTIDVDAAFAYKNKGSMRMIGGYFKDIFKRDWQELSKRTRVLLGKEKDPFDTFDYLHQIHSANKLKPIFFILFAEYHTNDKNNPTYNQAFQQLLTSIGDHAALGIHPSFNSNTVDGKLKQEIRNLSKIVHRQITKSRQHFLILHMPITYRKLVDLGITDDYTMGYAVEIGYRASTSRSFFFYDLEMEYTSSLRVHPFAVMEGTLRDYNHLDTAQSFEALKEVIDEAKKVGGTFMSLWHNESVSNQKRWVGWRDLYEKMIAYALPD